MSINNVSGRVLSRKVRVSVPGSSANLGPGFDSLGLALALDNELEAEFVDAENLNVVDGNVPESYVDISGLGFAELSCGGDNLLVKVMRKLFDSVGVAQPGIRINAVNRIPLSRGMGSSAAAIVSALVAANLVLPRSKVLSELELFRFASCIEGHPDNVAASLFGGLNVSWQEDGGEFKRLQVPVLETISAVAFVPPSGVDTSLARGLLPDEVAHRDASANAARSALLLYSLMVDSSNLFAGTADYLHQKYRAVGMPESFWLLNLLRELGYAAIISGAGPTVLVLGCSVSVLGNLMEASFLNLVIKKISNFSSWEVFPVAISQKGAKVVSCEEL